VFIRLELNIDIILTIWAQLCLVWDTSIRFLFVQLSPCIQAKCNAGSFNCQVCNILLVIVGAVENPHSSQIIISIIQEIQITKINIGNSILRYYLNNKSLIKRGQMVHDCYFGG
jgi:hypothetical protein